MLLDLQTITATDWLLMRREGLLTEKNEKEAVEKAGLGEIPFDLWQLTISDLGDLTSGAIPERIRDYYTDTTLTALQYVRRIAALRSFINLLNELLEKTTPVPYGPDAGIKVGGLIGIEGALIAVRSYFGLRSFTEAGDVTLADWYLSRKDLYRQNEFHRLAYEKQKQRQKQAEFKQKYKHKK
ncbi:MAG: hypothetical protein LUG23_05885 [Oscillospiraceae bacterium]|nr:hypothetical protein [Oscillospiraceae bacterium]